MDNDTLHPTFDEVEPYGAPARFGGPGETPDTHRGWTIYNTGRWPEPKWSATSPDYDCSWEGEEDGWVASGGHVYAATRDVLITEINNWIEENEA